jgi:hypothetical protein
MGAMTVGTVYRHSRNFCGRITWYPVTLAIFNGIYDILPVAVMTGGAGAGTVGIYIMQRINGCHVRQTLMTLCTGGGYRHLMRWQMVGRGINKEVATTTGYWVARNTAVDDAGIGVINMTALAGNDMSISRKSAAHMLVGHVLHVTLETGRIIIRHNSCVVIIRLGLINYIEMAAITVLGCPVCNMIIDIIPTAIVAGKTGFMLSLDTGQTTVQKFMTVGAPLR